LKEKPRKKERMLKEKPMKIRRGQIEKHRSEQKLKEKPKNELIEKL